MQVLTIGDKRQRRNMFGRAWLPVVSAREPASGPFGAAGRNEK
jgi:hypothetical protein